MNEDTRSLFEAIMDSAILLDRGGRIVDWNQNASALFGYSKKEVLGRSANFLYANNLPLQKLIQEILPQQKRWVEETPFIRKNGLKGVCKTCATLLQLPNQTKTLALITHQQITQYRNTINELQVSSSHLSGEIIEQHSSLLAMSNLLLKTLNDLEETEKNLRDSDLRFLSLAENSTDIISRHTTDGNYVYLSASCKMWLGYTDKELIGMNLFKYVHHEDLSKVKKAFNRRKANSNHNTVVYRMRRKEGDYRWFESNLRILRDEAKGYIREIQAASRDVTERVLDKKARVRGQQLAHVFRLSTMEEMASGMAHEISQPLAAIVNYTQGCVRYLENGHDPSQLTEIMQKTVSQAERAGEVIHRLKNFFCKGQLVKTTCKINSIIRESSSFIRNELNSSKTKVDFELAKELPLVSADKIQIQQVILNLMQNAIDAMKELSQRDRRIHIKTNPVDANTIEITVSDSGPGFSKEIITKVFKPFFTTKAHGRGMGLAICRSIIEAHRGQFTINPNTNGHSWIRFTLPVI